MIVMSTLNNAMDVAVKYISLAAIVNIPRIYFAAIKDNRMIRVTTLRLPIKYTRADNPLKGAPCFFHIMRYIYKLCRTMFCSFGFYFMPFIAIFINI